MKPRAPTGALGEHGYADLRIADVAARVGVGLGALYRRWPTKRDLVLDALRFPAAATEPPLTDNPRADLLAALEGIADAIAGPATMGLLGVLTPPDTDLAAALREAKLEPARASLQERLRRLVGDTHDLEARADLGPALILFRVLVLGDPVTSDEVRDEILPLMLAGAPSKPERTMARKRQRRATG